MNSVYTNEVAAGILPLSLLPLPERAAGRWAELEHAADAAHDASAVCMKVLVLGSAPDA